MKAIVQTLVVLGLVAGGAAAQDAPAQARRIDLTIHPAALPEPAMKDRLLPDVSEQTPGNAATLYLISFLLSERIAPDAAMDELLAASPADLPVDKARKFLAPYQNAIGRLEVAGRRDHCDWDPGYREEGFEALLPHLNQARQMAVVLAIDAKLAIREHHLEHAIRDLRIGFSLARNVNQNPGVVQSLVAVGIEATQLDVVKALVQEPDAPNLYWPLANLPSAGDQRVRMMQLEHAMLYYQFPGLRHAERMTAEESRRVVEAISRASGSPRVGDPAVATLMMIRRYPEAKRFLVSRGMDPHEVENLPANSVVLAYDVDQFIQYEEAVEKWMGLPLWQAYHGIADELQHTPTPSEAANPFLFVVPWHNRVLREFIRADRERDMLQIVEAIRAYAAAHDGALPKSLDDLSPQTPAPPDPLTGRPFEYSVSDATATLRGSASIDPRIDEVFKIKLSH